MIALDDADIMVAGGAESALVPARHCGFSAGAGAFHPQRRAGERRPSLRPSTVTAS
jgi:3-oxoacyl-(acyl-carrier-protein) synthase